MKTPANEVPIDLIKQYDERMKSPAAYDDHRAKFAEFKSKLKFVANENYKHDLATGDKILFWGGYNNDIQYISEILGFDERGWAYVLWDCYWFPVNLEERLIKKL